VPRRRVADPQAIADPRVRELVRNGEAERCVERIAPRHRDEQPARPPRQAKAAARTRVDDEDQSRRLRSGSAEVIVELARKLSAATARGSKAV